VTHFETTVTSYPEAAFAASRLSLSSAMLSFTPFPRGNDTYGLVALPIINTLFNLVSDKETIKFKNKYTKGKKKYLHIQYYLQIQAILQLIQQNL
jgi:hypothetical protein